MTATKTGHPPEYYNPYGDHEDDPFDISTAKDSGYGYYDEKNPHDYADGNPADTMVGDEKTRFPSDSSSTYMDNDRAVPTKRHSYSNDDQRSSQYAPVDMTDAAPLVHDGTQKKGWSSFQKMGK